MRISALLATASLAMQPVQAGRPCLTQPEAESLALVAMPQIIRQTGIVCAMRLPASSLLRRTDGPFIAKYDAAADAAWPAARGAVVKLSNPAADMLLDSDYARPLLTTLLTPLIVGRINPADCGTLDRLVTDLAPLPPRNTAGVIVTALRYAGRERAKGKAVAVPELPLCQDDRP